MSIGNCNRQEMEAHEAEAHKQDMNQATASLANLKRELSAAQIA